MQRIKIDNWSVVNTDFYKPPELRQANLQIQGNVYNHPRFSNGHRVITSIITKAEGNWIQTYSGSEYILGDPNPNYIEWMKINGKQIDPINPIKILSKRNN
ncbi:MAG: hypothetical protein ABIJ08_04120 [Nanoarchaeota archaeon]